VRPPGVALRPKLAIDVAEMFARKVRPHMTKSLIIGVCAILLASCTSSGGANSTVIPPALPPQPSGTVSVTPPSTAQAPQSIQLAFPTTIIFTASEGNYSGAFSAAVTSSTDILSGRSLLPNCLTVAPVSGTTNQFQANLPSLIALGDCLSVITISDSFNHSASAYVLTY